MDGVRFTPRSAEKIAQATRRVLRKGPSIAGPASADRAAQVFFEGELTEALTAPDDPLTDATTAKAKRWRPMAGSTATPVEMEVGDVEYDLVNRSRGLEADVGTHVIWVRVGNEWRVIWADCDT